MQAPAPREIEEDLDSLKNEGFLENKKPVYTKSTMEQVDDIMDHSIEIESNKRMRSANVNPWSLRFKDQAMEHQFSLVREDMFKSNMLCCFIIWLFIVASQASILEM